MGEKYEPVRGKNFRIGTDAGVISSDFGLSTHMGESLEIAEELAQNAIKKINEETQLDRVEKKVDRILELLENGDLSTSYSDVRAGFITTPTEITIYKKIMLLCDR